VAQVVIASPDKDLAQCVRGARVVKLDRIRKTTMDEDGVRARFGVGPASIPDFLALTGDSADGIPGLPRWGERSAAAVLGRWLHVDAIPDDETRWQVQVRGAAALARSLRAHRAEAKLYVRLATLVTDAPIEHGLEALAWRGADGEALDDVCRELGMDAARFALPRR
jgi:5'-3' exonuclease